MVIPSFVVLPALTSSTASIGAGDVHVGRGVGSEFFGVGKFFSMPMTRESFIHMRSMGICISFIQNVAGCAGTKGNSMPS